MFVILCKNNYYLFACDHLDGYNLGYTYGLEDLDHKSFIDQMFVSENELNDVNKYALPDSGQNFSDHCAIISSKIVIEYLLENVDVVNAS